MSRVKKQILELILEAALVSGEPQIVDIINYMQPGEKLRVHCKSGDEDLGMRELEYGQEYKWKFHDNFWGTTLYYCYVFWKDKSVSFDAYRHSRDVQKCFDCYGFFSLDGAYWWDLQQRQWLFKFAW